MPVAVNPETGQLLTSSQYAWSWPVHPHNLSDTEARVRVPRKAIGNGTGHLMTMPRETLATAYGELLEQGRSVLQQTYAEGDRMPRRSDGTAMDVRQQMAAEIADAGNGWRQGGAWRESHPEDGEKAPEGQYGAWDGAAAWLPATHTAELAVLGVQTVGTRIDIHELQDIHGHETAPNDGHDTAARWAVAIQTGRSIQGSVEPLRNAAQRCGNDVLVVHEQRDGPTDEPVAVRNTRDGIEVTAEILDREGPDSAKILYAKVRGELAAEHGPPQQEKEKALDALTASIVTARGTNGCGRGWKPPEPVLLKEAGTVLREQPERLQEVLERAEAVERKIYPPWPQIDRVRDRQMTRSTPEEDGRGSKGRDAVLDLFAEIREAEERLRRRHQERFRYKFPGTERTPERTPERRRQPTHEPGRSRGGMDVKPPESVPMIPPEYDPATKPMPIDATELDPSKKSVPIDAAELDRWKKSAPVGPVPDNQTVKMPEPREREAPPRPAPTRQPDRGR